jgi:hypothetical protein
MSVAPDETPATGSGPAAPTKYDLISAVIKTDPPLAISAIYTGVDPASTDVRKLWPHVLGTSPDRVTGNPVEMVLCCQYHYENHPTEIDTPHPSRKNFRCFRVSALSSIMQIPKPTGWNPFKFKIRNVNRQNNVEDPEFYR